MINKKEFEKMGLGRLVEELMIAQSEISQLYKFDICPSIARSVNKSIDEKEERYNALKQEIDRREQNYLKK